ncbi:unnamed protein product [Caenorhabditis nigoni]
MMELICRRRRRHVMNEIPEKRTDGEEIAVQFLLTASTLYIIAPKRVVRECIWRLETLTCFTISPIRSLVDPEIQRQSVSTSITPTTTSTPLFSLWMHPSGARAMLPIDKCLVDREDACSGYNRGPPLNGHPLWPTFQVPDAKSSVATCCDTAVLDVRCSTTSHIVVVEEDESWIFAVA